MHTVYALQDIPEKNPASEVRPAGKVVALQGSAAKASSSGKAKVVPPIRRPNCEIRSREYLTGAEVSSLRAAAGKIGRHGHRDSTMILLAYRHGLRVSELVALRW